MRGAARPGALAAPAPEVTGAPDRRGARLGAWLTSTDGYAVVLFVVIPLVAFVLPALAGQPALNGDNLLQNFPLRALSGQLLGQGHLPLWNPYIWSGSPLLGGLNAGALYPFTLIFAVLPALAAWVINLLVPYWVAALGTYLLLRAFALRPTACLLGAATYAYGGAMTGQLVHLPIIQGIAWMPLVVLAQFRLAWALFGTGPTGVGRSPTPRRSPWPWVLLLAASMGLILLTGEPRGIAEVEVVGAVVALWLTLRRYEAVVAGAARRLAYLGLSALGALWAVAIGAIQLIPGWSFITASQRANESFSFFASGSLRPAWSVLLLVPDLFGGSGFLHQPTFFNSYNLPEVTGYVGLLPLAGALVLLTRALGRRRDPRAPDWWLWLFLVALGILLTFGGYTVFGSLFSHIPLFGKTRLQSRNLGIVDLALAVLFACWVDRALGRHPEGAGLRGWRRALGAAVPLAAALLCLVALLVPARLEVAFGVAAGQAALGAALRPWLVVGLALALLSAALLLFGGRLGEVRRRRAICAVVGVDLCLFVLSSATALSLGTATAQPTRAGAAAVLGTRGRFAISDQTALYQEGLTAVGQPDLNAFTTLPSVQGYGSLVAGGYGTATGTHDLDTIDGCALARGVFVPLRLATLLTRSSYLAPPLAAGAVAPAPLRCPGAPAVPSSGRRPLYFGQVLRVSRADLAAVGPAGPGPGGLAVGILTPAGQTVFVPGTRVVRGARGWAVAFPTPERAAGLVVAGSPAEVSARSVATTATGARYALDGPLQLALGQVARWRPSGFWGQYARFEATTVRPPVWLADGAAGRARRLSSASDGTEVDEVRAPGPVTLVRSEAAQTGWHAELTPAGGGAARPVPVVARGLVQSVAVPAGDWTVRFTYRPAGITVGLVLSGLGVLAVAVLGVALVLARRRRASPGAGAGGR